MHPMANLSAEVRYDVPYREFLYLSPTEQTTVSVHVNCVMSVVPSIPCTTDHRLSGSRAGDYAVLFVFRLVMLSCLNSSLLFGKLSPYLNYFYFIFYLSLSISLSFSLLLLFLWPPPPFLTVFFFLSLSPAASISFTLLPSGVCSYKDKPLCQHTFVSINLSVQVHVLLNFLCPLHLTLYLCLSICLSVSLLCLSLSLS